VLAGPDAHTGLVADGMTILIESVAQHLVTTIRPGAATPNPQISRLASGHGADLQDEGSRDGR
jgi:hypothetical protein